MTRSLPLRCRCGTLRGDVHDLSPRAVTHVICYCRDCRAFANLLERPDVLDAAGGSEMVLVAQHSVDLTDGTARLACVRLTERGLFRWYASCCNTPIANTMRAGIPYAAVTRAALDLPSKLDPDAVLGESIAVWARSAAGAKPAEPPILDTLGLVGRSLIHMLRWKLGGGAFPSSFFDADTGAPRAVPRVLRPDERDRLRTRSAAFTA